MSTGLTGFILYNIFLTCSNVGLWDGLFFLHLSINCRREREWEKQTAFYYSKHKQYFTLKLLFSWCQLDVWSSICSCWKATELHWSLWSSIVFCWMKDISSWKCCCGKSWVRYTRSFCWTLLKLLCCKRVLCCWSHTLFSENLSVHKFHKRLRAEKPLKNVNFWLKTVLLRSFLHLCCYKPAKVNYIALKLKRGCPHLVLI